MWCDHLSILSCADYVRQAKDIENDSMVAQLLREDTAAGQDRESYEQNIKDCATSSFLGMTVKRMPSRLITDLVLRSLRSAKPALI